MAKGSLRVNGIIVDTDGEIKASTGDSIVIREDDGSAVITVDTNGKTSIGGPMDVGVNDTGHDVKFFGATAGSYLEWDESADELEIRGGAATPGKLLLSTAETTVVDGNKLGQIDFQAPLDSAGTDAILVGASIYAEADATFSSSVNATELVFATGASEAAAEKMRITSDGKVGIGSTAPATILDIADDQANGAGKTQVMRLYSGADIENDGPYLTLSTGMGDCRLGSYRQGFGGTAGGSTFYISSAYNDGTGGATATAEKFRVQGDGKVGIGTTAPETALHVNGTGGGVVSAIMVEDSNATSDQRRFRMYSSSQKAHFDIPNDAFNSATDVMAVDLSNGYVGIGTTAPDHLLHVSQTAASGMGMLVYRNKNAANSDNALAKIHNDHIDDDQAALHVRQDSAGYAIHVECNTNTTNYGNGIAISTQDENNTSFPLYIGTNTTSVEAGNARFVVRADGKVGIGTSAPNTHLEVSDGVPTFRLNSTEGNVGDTDILGEISWKSADANRTGDPIAYIRALSENATGSATGLAFGTGFDSNNASERMRIKNSGNVGIGSTNPGMLLDIAGASTTTLLRLRNSDTADQGEMQRIEIDGTKFRIGESNVNSNWAAFGSNGSSTGIRFITHNGTAEQSNVYIHENGNFYAPGGTVHNSTSDKRVKDNMESMDSKESLDVINSLRPITFNYNKYLPAYKPEDDTTTRYGFVADEVMEVIDDMVEIEPKAFLGGSPYVPEIEKEYVDDFKHLPTGKLIPFLVNAIKELSKEIEKLKSG